MKKLLKQVSLALVGTGSLLSLTGIVLMSVSTNYPYSNDKQVTTTQNLRHILGTRVNEELANYTYNVTFNCGKDNYKDNINIYITNKQDVNITPEQLDKLYPNNYISDVVKNANTIFESLYNKFKSFTYSQLIDYINDNLPSLEQEVAKKDKIIETNDSSGKGPHQNEEDYIDEVVYENSFAKAKEKIFKTTVENNNNEIKWNQLIISGSVLFTIFTITLITGLVLYFINKKQDIK